MLQCYISLNYFDNGENKTLDYSSNKPEKKPVFIRQIFTFFILKFTCRILIGVAVGDSDEGLPKPVGGRGDRVREPAVGQGSGGDVRVRGGRRGLSRERATSRLPEEVQEDPVSTELVLVRYSIGLYRSIAILVNVRYRYLVVSRYFDISNIE